MLPSRAAAGVLVVLALAGMALPSAAAAAVSVSDEAELRAALANSSVSEVVVTAHVNLTAGHLTVPPNRTLTLRGACGGAVQVAGIKTRVESTPGFSA
jgi:hypothetical protein